MNLFFDFRDDQRHHEKAKHVSEISDKFLFRLLEISLIDMQWQLYVRL